MKERYFYSNCFIETMKAKLKDPKNIKITIVPKSEKGNPHFLWSDGKHDYDFGIEEHLPWYRIFWFKGHIRQRALGFNEKYKAQMKIKRGKFYD